MSDTAIDDLALRFCEPPQQFAPIPFWFWNDYLEPEEIIRQIHQFHARGFGGFIPHARGGLSAQVGYLTDRWFELIRIAVQEAAKLDLKVILYDEAAYPSGSAMGNVVAENPEWASRALIPVCQTIEGPASGWWRPNPGRCVDDRLVCVVQGRQVYDERLDPASLKLLEVHKPGLVRYEVGEGHWELLSVWEVFAGGGMWGVFTGTDEGESAPPLAADLLNPQAVDAFIRHTHEAYRQHVGEYFGDVIVGIFTDEPQPMGRGAKRGPQPHSYYDGLLDEVAEHWEQPVKPWLASLWRDCGAQTQVFREAWDYAVNQRFDEVYYRRLYEWCEQNNLALAGHPARSNELTALHYFQLPGQDMVWRYVEPDSPSALEGDHSCAAKVATSAMLLDNRQRSATEVFGGYGWNLSMDECKWLYDWHMVRGNNLMLPHAIYYSVRGRRAVDGSEPDIGLHNVFGPHCRQLNDYARRICWLLSDAEYCVQVGVVTDGRRAGWSAAKELYEEQTDFVYLDEVALERANVEDGRLAIGSLRLQAVVLDSPNFHRKVAPKKLEQFQAAGGLVVAQWEPGALGRKIASVAPAVQWDGGKDLRVLHFCRNGGQFYLVVNEGEQLIEGKLTLASVGALQVWNPLSGKVRPWPAWTEADRLATWLRLERRQGLLVVVDPQGQPDASAALPTVPGEKVVEVSGPWQASLPDGEQVALPCPGDWAQVEGWQTFSGTVCFTTSFEIPAGCCGQAIYLDLEEVGQIAEVLINDELVGAALWDPYRVEISDAVQTGNNTVMVRVTNNQANYYDGLQLPSGLLGPVCVRTAKQITVPPEARYE